MSQYHFIGGAPLTGKSTLTRSMAGYIPLSTDVIRDFLINILPADQHANLFYDQGLDAVGFYDKYKDAKTVFEHELKQAAATQKGIDAVIKTDFEWDKIALEGIAITPEYLAKLKDSGLDFEYTFLYDEDVNRMKERIYSRGLYDDADKYPDYIKEIELQWVVMYNEYYKTECEKYKFKLNHV